MYFIPPALAVITAIILMLGYMHLAAFIGFEKVINFFKLTGLAILLVQLLGIKDKNISLDRRRMVDQLAFVIMAAIVVIIILIFGSGYLFAIMGFKALLYILAGIGILALLRILL